MASPDGARLRRAARECWHLLREMAGERAYEHYLARHCAHHPEVPPMSEREFWRQRDTQEPPTRCC